MTNTDHSEPLGRILAIEPDPDDRAALERALCSQVRAELLFVASVEEALAKVASFIPDLILTSTFLPPADEEKLTTHLKECPETSHTRVITLPQVADPGDRIQQNPARVGAAVLLRFARRREVQVRLCNPQVLREHVESYLEQAQSLRLGAEDRRQRGVEPIAGTPRAPLPDDNRIVPSSTALVLANEKPRTLTSTFQLPRDRRRASRHRASDLPGSLRARLAASGDITLVDISSSGVLLETKKELAPGSIVHLQMQNADANVSVVARLVRSERTRVDGSEWIYRVAAAFAREIDLRSLRESRTASAQPPKVLGDLLGRVLADAHWMAGSTTLCSKFEDELKRLMHVKDIRIGAVPLTAPAGCRSFSYPIPDAGDGSRRVLQAIVEAGRRLDPVEIRLLKAAAGLAGIVLGLATTHDA
jgi:CheY-like chemotaxis protein